MLLLFVAEVITLLKDTTCIHCPYPTYTRLVVSKLEVLFSLALRGLFIQLRRLASCVHDTVYCAVHPNKYANGTHGPAIDKKPIYEDLCCRDTCQENHIR